MLMFRLRPGYLNKMRRQPLCEKHEAPPSISGDSQRDQISGAGIIPALQCLEYTREPHFVLADRLRFRRIKRQPAARKDLRALKKGRRVPFDGCALVSRDEQTGPVEIAPARQLGSNPQAPQVLHKLQRLLVQRRHHNGRGYRSRKRNYLVRCIFAGQTKLSQTCHLRRFYT
jgi:hypothetical protein